MIPGFDEKEICPQDSTNRLWENLELVSLKTLVPRTQEKTCMNDDFSILKYMKRKISDNFR